MTYYVFHQADGFDRATASKCETLAEAGREILAYDQQDSGVENVDGEFVPWQLPHRGPKKILRPFAAESEAKALEAIALSDAFDLEAIDDTRASEIEAELAAEA